MANEFKVKNGLIVIGDLTTSGTITINGALAATQSWVTSQAYLTSASLSGYATQSYVTSAISSLIDAAPAALDTLNELAAALGDDANFSTTITNSIANKVAKSGDTMTGSLLFANVADNVRLQKGSSFLNLRDPWNNIHLYNAGDGNYIDSNIHYWRSQSASYWMTLNNGNLGIGTVSPVSRLDVDGIISSRGIFIAQNSGTYNVIYNASNSVSMYLGGSGDPANYYDNTTHNFRSSGGGTTYAVITNGGNVGIGTTSPGYKLHVNGNSYFADTMYNGGGHISWTSGYSDGTTQTYNGNSLAFLTNSSSYTARMFITSGGNVGIGTTTPTEKLHVVGNILIPNGNTIRFQNDATEIGRGIKGKGVNDLVVNYYDKLFFRDEQDASDYMSIINGNVGIGTTSPSAKLHVNPSTTNEIAIAINGTQNYSANQFQRISAGDGSSLNRVAIGFGYNSTPEWTIRYSSYHNHEFFTGNDWGSSTEKMRITTGGNVGIGTTSPQSRLDLAPPASQSTLSTLGYSANAQLNIRIPNSTGDVGQIVFTNDAAPTAGYASIGVVMTSGAGVGIGDIIMSTKSVGSDAASTERMRINSSGYVGIGTNSPDNKLTVKGDNALIDVQSTADGQTIGFLARYLNSATLGGAFRYTTGDAQLYIDNFYEGNNGVYSDINIRNCDTGGNLINRIKIKGSNGNVGIGTVSPSEKLDVLGNIKIYNETGLITDYGPLIGRYNTSQIYIGTGGSYSIIKIGRDDGAALNVLSGGNVGIGTVSPNYKLDVNGSINIYTGNSLRWGSGDAEIINSGYNLLFKTYNGSALAEAMRINSTGKVSIGTTDTNSDKSDFTVYTGSGASLALVDDQVRMGSTDVNWGVALRSTGYLETYGQALYLQSVAGNHPVVVRPNNTSSVEFYQDYTLFNGLNLSISRINSAHAANYFRGDSSHLVIGTGGTLYLNYGGNTTIITGNTTVSGLLGVTGIVSANARKLSLGILDLNSGITPAQYKIKTNIPWNYGGSDFTVNIKGFRYGVGQMVSLSIGWHYYNNEFYNRNAISNGAWAPTISLAKSPDGYVIIYIPGPDYWPKLYVESVYSSNSADSYTSGWSWTDADLSDCTLIQTVPYKDLATNISGNAATATSATTAGALSSMNISQFTNNSGYLTSYTETDTLASVTGRGASTSTAVTFNGGVNLAANTGIRKSGDNWIIGYDTSLPGIAIGSGTVTDKVSISSGGIQRVWFDTNGKVGIGTSTPAEELHVIGRGIFNGGSGNSSTDAVVYITKSTNDDWGLYVNASALDYAMYARVSPSAGYALAIHNGTTWTTRITGNAIIYLGEKNAIEGNYDTWLRLNNSLHYASGVYTPGVMRADGGFYVSGSTVWHAGNDGSGSGLDADTVDGVQASSLLRSDIYNSNYGGLQVFRNIGTIDGSWEDSSHTFSLENGDAGNIVLNFHRAGYTSNNLWYNGSKFRFDAALESTGIITATGGNSTNWNTAYSWGNHASASYATTSYVTTQINNLINGAPGVLDTLDELAAALGDDANFATTVTNSIAGKVSKAGDTMTGALNIDYSNAYLYIRSEVSGSGVQWHKQMWFGRYDNIQTPGQYPNYLPAGAYGYHVTQSSDALFVGLISRGAENNDYNAVIAWGDDAGDVLQFRFNNNVVATLSEGGSLTIAGSLTESSSIKLKENVETSEGNLEKVVNLRPVTYNKIGSQTKELGLIAEEVAEVYPEFVQYDENGEPVGVNYSRLTAALIGAVKELTNQVQELNKKING